MDEMTQSVMNYIHSDRRQLILQVVTHVLSHLQSIEDTATQHEKTLIKHVEDLTAYQVCL